MFKLVFRSGKLQIKAGPSSIFFKVEYYCLRSGYCSSMYRMWCSTQLMSKLTLIMADYTPTYRVDGDCLASLGNRIHKGCCHHATPAPSLSAHPLRARQSRLTSDPLVQAHQRAGPVRHHLAAIQHERHQGLGCRRGYSITHGLVVKQAVQLLTKRQS